MDKPKLQEQIESKIFSLLDIFRKENVKVDDYYVALLFLSLVRINVFKRGNISSGGDFIKTLEEALKKNRSKDSDKFLSLIPHFETSLKKISNPGIEQLITHSKILLLLSEDIVFAEIFDQILYGITKAQGRHGGEIIQPMELTKFLIDLANLPENARVFNPFAGLASFGVFLNANQYYYGQELNPKIWAIGQLRLMAHDRTESAQYVCEDSEENWPKSNDKFDLVISHPPFMNFSYSGAIEKLQKSLPRVKSHENFLIESGIPSLKRNGKLIAILPQGFLFNQSSSRLRKRLTEENLLDTIISLPGGLLSNTSIPLIILILNTNKKYLNKIRFIDGNDFVEIKNLKEKTLKDIDLIKLINNSYEDSHYVRIIERKQVQENKFNLNVSRYFLKQIKGGRLGGFLEVINKLSSKNLQDGRLVRIKDLKADRLDFNLEWESIELSELWTRNVNEIDESCLLIASRWKTLKPTWFEFTGTPIYVHKEDIIALRLNQEIIDKAFLINELYSDYVLEQINAFRTGMTIPRIQWNDLTQVIIKIPPRLSKKSLEIQKAKVEGIIEEVKKSSQKEVDQKDHFKEIIEGINRDLISREHSIRQLLAPLNSNISGTKKFLENNSGNPIDLQTIYSQKFDLTLEDHILNALDIIKKINNLLLNFDQGDTDNSVSDIIHLVNESMNKFKQEEIFSFDDLEIDEESFSEINANKIPLKIKLNQTSFEKLFLNVIENAVNHGFKGVKSGNRIKISISYLDANFILTISNNGKLIDNEFSYEKLITLGEKTTDSSGTGIGGSEIKKIVDNSGGSFWAFNDLESSIFKVIYIFKFPHIIDL